MENMTFYDFITLAIDIAGVWFLFQNSFNNFLKNNKNTTLLF